MSGAEAISKEIGTTIETVIISSTAALENGERTNAHFDALAVESVSPGEVVPSIGREIPADAPVEIKAAAEWVQNGDRRTSGGFYIKRKSHDWLRENDGWYLLCVHDFGRPPEILGAVAMPATEVGDCITAWSEVGGIRSENEVAKLAWTRVIDRETIDGGREA